MTKTSIMNVQGVDIALTTINEEDYICLTDMVKWQEDGLKLIEKWLSNKNTIEFLGIWEQINNPKFNSPEFEGIRNEAGTNRFYLSVKRWAEKTCAIGIKSRAGSMAVHLPTKTLQWNLQHGLALSSNCT